MAKTAEPVLITPLQNVSVLTAHTVHTCISEANRQYLTDLDDISPHFFLVPSSNAAEGQCHTHFVLVILTPDMEYSAFVVGIVLAH